VNDAHVTPPVAVSPALHRFAILLVGATLVLIFVGGLVTTTGSGLAVPDWPLSFGVLFPRMVGGVLYEHGHRMVATAVGFLTLVLALVAHLVHARQVVRRLSLLAIVVVIAQGVLGGITVLWLLPIEISVAHACLAQAFLCLTVAIAMLTGPSWNAHPRSEDTGLRLLTLATVATVYVQLILGAVMRHSGAGLAIPDFPLAFGRLIPPFDLPGVTVHYLHRLGAVAVTIMVAASYAAIRARHGHEAALTRPARLAVALVVVQVTLGALTIWTEKAIVITTAHVACGAALLATTFGLALRTWNVTAPHTARTTVLVGEHVTA
jgi:cytochrome c oxidase assembly protein subunit 15